MSTNEDGKTPPEIVIIRRKFDDEDGGHHGGMWKIAFADFMTAMMAFFLVMWLINATDEQVLNQVATYFNPMKLPDVRKAEKGLQTSDGGGGQAGKPAEQEEHGKQNPGNTAPQSNEPAEEKKKGKGEQQSRNESPHKAADEALFTDPYGVLSKLASQAVRVPLPVQAGLRQDEATPFAGGTAFRDPFDPEFRRTGSPETAESPDRRLASLGGGASSSSETDGGKRADAAPPQPETKAGTETETAPKQPESPAVEPQPAPELAGVKPETGPQAAPPAAAKAVPARQLEAEIRGALRAEGIQNLPQIGVEATSEGLLISLTDKLNFEMFAIASAQPRPELVVTLEKIGDILRSRPGQLVIRGHTDGRPFRSAAYDNWRLSTARAHIAYHMLARGGVGEQRIERIEGHANRQPKTPDDPKAAANRRIEILIKQAG